MFRNRAVVVSAAGEREAEEFVDPAVAAHFGVVAESFIGDSSNAHWFVRWRNTRLVLRRYRPARSLASAAYEAALLTRLRAAGRPVAEVIDAPVVIGGRVWLLMTVVPGEAGTYETDDPRRRGRQLASLHEDLATMTDLGQRDGRQFCDEVIDSPGLDAALDFYATLFADDARVMRTHVDTARTAFARHDAAALPRCVIHGDFAPWNLHFADGELVGIVDFDLAHLDYRIADFALSWRGKYDGVVEGYGDVSPLTDAEWNLLPAARWAWLLIGVEDAINDMRAGRVAPHRFAWVIDQLGRRSPLMRRAMR